MTADLSDFLDQRPRLFGLAYRLLGSAQDAEDVVQDAYLRWSGADRSVIENPPAWLAKVVTNLALNRLTSARAQREHYVGPWLPEPVLTDDGTLGPMETAVQRESVSFAVLVLLERLTPAERAVFVLREAFGYSHREIAEILDVTDANSRQLHRRARQHVGETAPRFEADRAQRESIVERFLAAATHGDLDGLESILTADAVSWADGGGQVAAARRPVVGRDRVARYVAGAMAKFLASMELTPVDVNGEPGLLARLDGQLAGVLVPALADGRLRTLHFVANPEKLRFLERQLSRSEEAAGS